MAADSLFQDARLSGANGACVTTRGFLFVCVPGTSRVSCLTPQAGGTSTYLGDCVLPIQPQAICTDGTYLYVLGVNVLYILTVAPTPVLVSTITLVVTYPTWIVLANGFLVTPHDKGGVQSITTSGVVTSILPDLLSTAQNACVNSARVYVFDPSRALARTLTVSSAGALTETSNDVWYTPNCRTVTSAFMDGSTLVLTTDKRIITFSTTDPDNPAFLSTTTVTQTINSAVLLSTGNYFLFTNETVKAQNQTFPYPSQGGALFGGVLFLIHGTVGGVSQQISVPNGPAQNIFVQTGLFIGSHIKGAAGDAAACCSVACIGYINSSGAGGTASWSAVDSNLVIGCIAPDGTVGNINGPFSKVGTYWFYGTQSNPVVDVWGSTNTTDTHTYSATITYGSQVLTLNLTKPLMSCVQSPSSPSVPRNTTGTWSASFTHVAQPLYTLTGSGSTTVTNGGAYTGVATTTFSATAAKVGSNYTNAVSGTITITTGFNSALPPNPPLGVPFPVTLTVVDPVVAAPLPTVFGSGLTGYPVVLSYVYNPTPHPAYPYLSLNLQ